MTKLELQQAVQSRTARIAVSASAVRGRGHSGAVEAARRFMRKLDLSQFGSSPRAFRRALDKETRALLAKLPRGARRWGMARKLLNIFLRDCLYTTYLEAAFNLRKTEASFEVPLDSITALSLKRIAGRGGLPRWPGVKHVT